MAHTFGEVVEELRRSTVQVRAHRNGSGSGVIWSPDGRIVTNAHVVEGASGEVMLDLWDGRRVPGKIVKRDRRRDLAVLQADASGLPAAVSVDSHALRVGELVIAVGNPLGFTGAASTGVIHRLRSRNGAGSLPWVVSQIRLAPGNSGGPLANARGEIVGINTMIAGGLAFAVPAESAAEILEAAVRPQPGLGVVVRPVVAGQLGFLVLEVVPNSPADRASLLQGDVLVGAGGRRFSALHELEAAIGASHGGILDLQFRRGGNEKIRSVPVRVSPSSVRAA